MLTDGEKRLCLAAVRARRTSLKRVHRQRAEHDGRDERERAVERGGMESGSGPAGQGARIKVQAGFRR